MVRNYDASRQSLYQPGAATDFFEHGIPPIEAALCAEMSRLAYVKEPALLETYLTRAGFALQQTLGYGSGGTQVFMATAPDASGQETLLVAFRGTEGDDWDDLQTDANCRMVAWQAGMGKVHAGFAAALQGNGVLDAIRTYVATKSAVRVLLTGHSLGAALATLAASIIPSAHLYTFGCPRVGDKVFAEALRSVRHERYVDCCDLVTDVPPEWLGYVHVGELYYIARNGQVLDSPDAALIAHDRRQATLAYWLHYALLPHNVWVRRLADHAPINYVTALR